MGSSLEMKTVFSARLYGRFIEIQNILKRKKIRGTNEGNNFLGANSSIRDNVRAPIQF